MYRTSKQTERIQLHFSLYQLSILVAANTALMYNFKAMIYCSVLIQNNEQQFYEKKITKKYDKTLE